jgi:site-specific recombinase XerC
MKNGTNKTSISMISPTNDDLKAIHSIEAILGIKNLDNHHHHHHSQQHLFPSHLLSSSKLNQEKLGSKKRSSNEHYPDSML